jgi:acyl transferase domain-containing protein/NADPH:quinone reductase-like Zn-dependent oxidoreductase/acyl carrier protein
LTELRGAFDGLEPRSAVRALRAALLERVRSFLGSICPPALAEDPRGAERTFVEWGFDSLRSVDFKELLERELQCELSATLLIDAPTPAALAEVLGREVFGWSAAASDAAGAESEDPRNPLSEGASSGREDPRGGRGVVGGQRSIATSTTTTSGTADDSPAARQQLELARTRLRRAAERLAELEAAEARRREPIAIVGMGCRFPGGVVDRASFSELLDSGRDGLGDIPPERFDARALLDPQPDVPGKLVSARGGFLPELDRFDARFFGISAPEALELDPQQRLLLEETWRCLEDAGVPPERWRGRRVGVFLGGRGSEYFDAHTDRRPIDAGPYYATGNALSTCAGRLSFTFGWTGPSFALDTACSSSLVALHQAVRSLRAGECEHAVAGGVNLILDPVSSVSVSRANMLSPRGRCASFSNQADGYVRAEGCGLVLLTPYSRALEQGLRPLALVRGTAVNSDGRSGGLTVPSGAAQESVLRAALEDAGLPPGAVQFVAAHGTGTELGDPIEVRALDAVYGKREGQRLLVGALKTQIGHGESSAGIAGLLQVLISMRERRLPGLLHFEGPNPHVDWERLGLELCADARPWPATQGARTGAVSSFGFSGTNAHAVLSEAPPLTREARPLGEDPALLPLSAHSSGALRQLAAEYLERLDRGAELRALAGSACHHRSQLHQRCAVVLPADPAEQRAALEAVRDGARTPERSADDPGLAFLFGGQGSQRPGAGRALFEHAPVFRRSLERCAAVVDELLERPLLELLFDASAEQLSETHLTQPVVFALQAAQADWLASLGLTPAAALGHSVGELAAAYTAGVFDLETGARLAALRGRVLAERVSPGAMLAVGATPDEAEALAERHGLSVAAYNANGAITLSGPTEAIEAARVELRAGGRSALRLATSRAFHSPAVDGALDELRRIFKGVELQAPRLPLISGRTGTAEREAWTDPQHWVRSMREPVRFDRALEQLRPAGAELALELGGSAPLAPLVARQLGHDLEAKALLTGRGSETHTSLEALGWLWERGAPLDLRRVGADGDWDDLPRAPFERERFWYAKRGAHDDGPRLHPLLHQRRPAAGDGPDEDRLHARLWSDDPAWLADHQVHGLVLFPGSGFAECALAALHLHPVRAGAPIGLRDLSLRAPLAVGTEGVELECRTSPADDGLLVELHARQGDAARFTLHASARALESSGTATPLDVHRDESWRECPIDAFQATLAERGLDYGPRFRGLVELWTDGSAALGRVQLPHAHDAGAYLLHPALLDACFQACGAVLFAEGGPTYLPVAIDCLEVERPGPSAAEARLTRRDHAGRSAVFDLDLTDPESGACIARLRGLRLAPAEPARLRQALERDDRLLHVEVAEPCEPRADADAGATSWTAVVAGTDPRARALHAQGFDVHADFTGTATAEHSLWLPESERSADPERIAGLLDRARQAYAAGVQVWVLRGARARFAGDAQLDLAHAALLGFARSLRREDPARAPRILDLDPGGDPQWLSSVKSALADSTEPELARRSGQWLAPRLGSRERAREWGALPLPEGSASALTLSDYGSFDHLGWSPRAHRAPGPGEVEVAFDCAALNFKDTLYALGLLDDIAAEDPSEQPLGFEGVGTVTRAGDAGGPPPGTRVVVSAPGCLATHACVPNAAARPVAEALGAFAGYDLCAVRTTGITAWHALVEHAGLQAGETVLIHAAAGGVGQVAVALARSLGARVFATASLTKRADVLAAGAEAVFDSRSTNFREGVLAATGGRGVDVVLNSLRDDFVDAGFGCLAAGGRFIEIGRLGTWEPERANRERPDAHYVRFDLEQVFDEAPETLERLTRAVDQALERGQLAPPEVSLAPAGAAPAAFARLAGARLSGKQVLSLPPRAERLTLSGDGTLLVTGGTGAVGPALAEELIARGARRVLAIARNAPDAAAQARLDALRAAGAEVEFRTCDASDAEALAQLVEERRAVGQPITAVLHAAGQLGDGLLDGLDADAFAARRAQVLGAKLDGALALDALLPDLELFALASSITAWLGNAGQTLYGAANAALDALAERRRGRGQRAVSVAFGPWADQGMASRLGETEHARLARFGWRLLAPTRARSLFAAGLDTGRASVAAFDAELERYAQASGTAEPYLASTSGARARTGAARFDREEWLALATEERGPALLVRLSSEVAGVLGGSAQDLDPRTGFADLGLDSLLAVDLKGRLERVFEVELPATVAFDAPNLEALAQLIGERLDPQASQDGASARSATNDDAPQPEGSTDQLAAELARELGRLEGGSQA